MIYESRVAHTISACQSDLSLSHNPLHHSLSSSVPHPFSLMKLKPPPRPLFSCSFFRHCTQTPLSPTTPHPPQQSQPSSSSSSSSSTSQSFTQWRFPLPNSPPRQTTLPPPPPTPPPPPPPIPFTDLQQLFHLTQLQLTSASNSEQLAALHLLERSLVPNPPSHPSCPSELMRGVVNHLKHAVGAKPAAKVLLALCLAEGNRPVAVEAGAVGAVVEAAPELDGAVAERALAALELMCTVAEGAEEIRAHALAVPVMVMMMGRTAERVKEYAISVLAVIYGGGYRNPMIAPPEEVARAVVLALQGECSARGRRKGAQLLKVLEEPQGLESNQEENEL